MNCVYQQMWISLPKNNRARLAHVFDLTLSGVTEVRDQTIISDGYTNDDLKGITLEKMCEYIGSQETFGRAWEITLAKCHSELNPPIGEIGNLNGQGTIVAALPEQEKIEIETVKETLEKKVEEKKSAITFTTEEPKPRWCETCDSKGVCHKYGCPQYRDTRNGEKLN